MKHKKAIIMGATSGIGYETALILLRKGWTLGLAGRRTDLLGKIKATYPQQTYIKAIDVCQPEAPQLLQQLIDEMGGIDLYFHCSGIGHQNYNLNPEIEIRTLETNGTGFTRMITHIFHYFMEKGQGHIAPAYSATKRFQNTYIDALEQLAHIHHKDIRFTDIRPGFVATSLLNDNKKYPMLMRPDYAARIIVKALNGKKRVKVVNWRYSILVFFWQLIPRCIWKRMRVKN